MFVANTESDDVHVTGGSVDADLHMGIELWVAENVINETHEGMHMVDGTTKIVVQDASKDLKGDLADYTRLDGGGNYSLANSESPFMALSPLLEKAINELKETKSLGRHKDIGGRSGQKPPEPARATVGTGESFTPLRRSLRRVGSVDEDSLERASRLVAKRNLEVLGGVTLMTILFSIYLVGK